MDPSFESSYPEDNEPHDLTVTDVVTISRDHLHGIWECPVWVCGEVSKIVRPASGHVYLDLKDDRSIVSCVIYASNARKIATLPREGTELAVLAKPTIYVNRGRFQLVVTEVKLRGRGALYEQFLRMKEDLRKKGWFDQARKRKIPFLPSAVGVVVSPDGAAWHDVKKTLNQRFASIPIKLIPAPAQGQDAARLIARAISSVKPADCDVLLVCRGGGSIEDLHAYNEIEVAEAISNAAVPVISGVGHETDETIADYVADLRAATPTAAAVAAVPERVKLLEKVTGLEKQLHRALRQTLNDARQRVDEVSFGVNRAEMMLSSGLMARLDAAEANLGVALADKLRELHSRVDGLRTAMLHPLNKMLGAGSALRQLGDRLAVAAKTNVARRLQELDSSSLRLAAMSPQRTLERGYAMVTTSDRKVATRASQIEAGQEATVVFADGAMDATFTGAASGTADFLDEKG